MPSKIAYIVSRFPHLPETFILREMITLEKLGWQIELYPLIIQQQSVMHEEARPWLRRAHTVPWFSRDLLKANWGSLIRQPRRYLSLFLRTLQGNLHTPKFLARALLLFPRAVWMADRFLADGINHVHAHYATHPALVAWLINQLTGITYSITVHAHDIFAEKPMLATKLQDSVFISAISEFNRKYLTDLFGPWVQNKTQIVRCGIDPALSPIPATGQGHRHVDPNHRVAAGHRQNVRLAGPRVCRGRQSGTGHQGQCHRHQEVSRPHDGVPQPAGAVSAGSPAQRGDEAAGRGRRVMVLELMGRDAGFIALQAGVAGGAASVRIEPRPATGPNEEDRRARDEAAAKLAPELQALVAPTSLGTPRRAVVGWDPNRLSMLLAVLEARCGVRLAGHDVYLNVAGGMRLAEPAADLAAAAALLSSFAARAAPEDSVYFGEVSLTGAVRAVGHMDQRLKEAAKLGFARAMVPEAASTNAREAANMQLLPLSELSELVAWFALPPE